MMTKIRIDQIGGLFWLILGGAICFESTQLDIGTTGSPGAGFLPFLVGCLFEIFAVIFLVRPFFIKGDERIAGVAILGTNWRQMGVVFVSLIVYGIILLPLGYPLSTFFLLSFLFNMNRVQGWLTGVAGAAAISGITYWVFRVGMDCPLPKGIFG